MNILQVVPELNAGGVERTTIEIAQALSAAGHVPHVASEGGRMEEDLRAAGGVLHHLPMGSKNPLLLRKNTRALVRIIKSQNIQIVHARSRAPAWAAKAAAQATGVAFVTTYHGIYNAKSRIKRRYNAIMAKGEIIIANSQFTKAHIIKEHNIAPKRITVIPRGVDMDIFDPAHVQESDIKSCHENWGLAADTAVLLLPGRLTRWKGQLVAIKALPLVRETIDAKLVLLGDAQGRDDYVSELQTLAESLNIGNHVIIAGHSQDMPRAYAASDLVISASTDPEAFGRIAAEAQAMGKFVAASAHGGALETILDNHTGMLTTPGDSEALARGILSLLSWTQTKKNNNSAAARQHIARNFSANAMKTATLAVYTRLLAGKGK